MRNRVLFKDDNKGSACIKWKGVVYVRLKKGEPFYYVASEMTYTALLSLKHCGKTICQ